MVIFADLSSESGLPGAANPRNPDNPEILPPDNHLPYFNLPEFQPHGGASVNNILIHAPDSLLNPAAAADTNLNVPEVLLEAADGVVNAVEALRHLEARVVDVGHDVGLHGAEEELRNGLLELVHLLGEVEVAVNVPAAGGQDLVGELDAGPEKLRETVELGLAEGGELDAGVLYLLDGGEELVDVGDELVGTGAAEERLPGDADEHFEKLRRDLSGEEVIEGHYVV